MQFTRNVARKYGAKLALVPAAVGGFITSAHAELPAAATTAVGDYKTDALAALALVMGAAIAIWGLKKLMVKMGWS